MIRHGNGDGDEIEFIYIEHIVNGMGKQVTEGECEYMCIYTISSTTSVSINGISIV